MGNQWSGFKNNLSQYTNPPGIAPLPDETYSFDPMFGFPEGARKERKMVVTKEDMISCGIGLEDRDYCAHLLIEYHKCTKTVYPWLHKCTPHVHAWQNCQFEDYRMRMKEFERERRLRLREKRIEKAALA